MSGNPHGAKPYAGRGAGRPSFWHRRVRSRARRPAATEAEALRAMLEVGSEGAVLRVRTRDALALRAVLERHGATVTAGLDDGVLIVADMGAAQIAQLAAIRGIVLIY